MKYLALEKNYFKINDESINRMTLNTKDKYNKYGRNVGVIDFCCILSWEQV